jgi:Tfp pilus assembly PilM family ATPase
VSFVHLRRDEFSPCGWRRLDHGFALHRPDQSLASVLSDLSLPEDVPYVINAGSPRYCIVKKISLPDWTEEEFYQSLAWEIEQYIPYDMGGVYFDGMSLPGDLHQGYRDYLITATKKDELDPILQAMAGKDLKVMIATPTEMALLAAFEHCYPQSVSGNTALVDYSPDGTQILVLRDGQIAFSRHISSIGGVPLERMVVEVKRSLDFFNATNMDTDIQRVLVSGYDYRDQELGLLSEKLQLPVENFVIPQPGPVGTLNSAHVMAYGLALIGLGF